MTQKRKGNLKYVLRSRSDRNGIRNKTKDMKLIVSLKSHSTTLTMLLFLLFLYK